MLVFIIHSNHFTARWKTCLWRVKDMSVGQNGKLKMRWSKAKSRLSTSMFMETMEGRAAHCVSAEKYSNDVEFILLC